MSNHKAPSLHKFFRLAACCFFTATLTIKAFAMQPQVQERDFPEEPDVVSEDKPPIPPPPTPIEESFADYVHEQIWMDTMGYSLVVLKGDELLIKRNFGLSKSEPDGFEFWTEDTPMHVASTSKFITAVAISRIFAANGVGPVSDLPTIVSDGSPTPSLETEPIAPYLPAYWTKGPGIDQITIGQLLSHRSGLGCFGSRAGKDAGQTTFAFAKLAIQMGTSSPCPSSQDYENVNYTLLRIILATVTAVRTNPNAGLAPNSTPSIANMKCNPTAENALDCAWDQATSKRYVSYVQSQIFRPGQIRRADVKSRPGTANYYRHQCIPCEGASGVEDFSGSPPEETEETDEEVFATAARSGPIGWIITPSELARLGRAVQKNGDIISTQQLDLLKKDRQYPLEAHSAAGVTIYHAGGSWGREMPEVVSEMPLLQGRVKSWIYLAPNDTVIVLFTNSEIGGESLLRRAYNNFPIGLN